MTRAARSRKTGDLPGSDLRRPCFLLVPIAVLAVVVATVLVHGLDSSKQTWHAVLPKLHEAGLPALALDQRGHGESPLGDPETFSTEALARDVIHAVEVQHEDFNEGIVQVQAKKKADLFYYA